MESKTLYVNRLDEKIGKEKMKLTLFAYFSNFGTILDISISKALKKKGQAWITYDNVESAIKAKNALNNLYLFREKIQVQFAKQPNDILLKLTGKYNPYGRKSHTIGKVEAKNLLSGPIPYHYDYDMNEEDDKLDNINTIERDSNDMNQTKKLPTTSNPILLNDPTNILFVQNLPKDISIDELRYIFGQYSGYVEARIHPTHPGIAFVEYETSDNAYVALTNLNGLVIEGDVPITIQFRR